MKRCCFSGHRVGGLPWKDEERGIRFWKLKRKLTRAIENSIRNGYNHFMSGMAVGIDVLCAEIVLKLKKKHPEIKLECIIPCLNQTEKWGFENKIRYQNILNKSDKIVLVSKSNYFDGCMQKRNRYMISNSELLIAVYDGISGGGTKNTINAALKKGIEVVILKT